MRVHIGEKREKRMFKYSYIYSLPVDAGVMDSAQGMFGTYVAVVAGKIKITRC